MILLDLLCNGTAHIRFTNAQLDAVIARQLLIEHYVAVRLTLVYCSLDKYKNSAIDFVTKFERSSGFG